ncbi:MAG: chemotaxis protein CheW [Deltaproteobacteria bacterium]|nr:chemotaxis protein CheW [Deltaproteobacteria bacterium]
MSSNEKVLVLLFRAGGERASVRAADVQKVTPVGHISRLPRLPSVVTGITQHRGRVVTVVDAAALLFGAAPAALMASSGRPLSPDARLLILERPVRHVGLLVDAVDEIEGVRLSADLPPGHLPCLRVATHKGKALQVVDVEKLMDAVEVHTGTPVLR